MLYCTLYCTPYCAVLCDVLEQAQALAICVGSVLLNPAAGSLGRQGKSIWASRSTLEKVLAVLCLVLLAMVLLLVALMAKQDQNIMHLHFGHGIGHRHSEY